MSWKKVVWRGGALAALVLAPAVGLSSSVPALTPVPNTFTPGAVISSSEMNSNFDTVEGSLTAIRDTVNNNATILVIRTDGNDDGTQDYSLAANCDDAGKLATGGGCKIRDDGSGLKASYPITSATPDGVGVYAPSEYLEAPIGWACLCNTGIDINCDVDSAFAVCSSGP